MIQPYLADTRPHADATDLLAAFGALAGEEARARADRSRHIGNHIHFCRWRQVERLIAMLRTGEASGTIH